ncbi:MAG: hypothetical protein QME32_02115 [Endomicrobiia bacterium]|nr:hypothetical protein [Endomicrobiia bacterium]
MTDIMFVGDSDFAEAFEAFGFATRIARTADEFRAVLGEASKSSSLRLVCASASLEIPAEDAKSLSPSADIVYLPDLPDSARAIEHYRALSEKASGVDLTGKLIET